ncbi:hypothetical protein MRB53_034586 [Persea americana]|uniref:Uncharacterized protein n=1 Tax=Persea americana TaxID=3435 RepID=A0ACC2K2A0_PERAE|nr:hypothetical protein MRB53_034586 [Persea americana]
MIGGLFLQQKFKNRGISVSVCIHRKIIVLLRACSGTGEEEENRKVFSLHSVAKRGRRQAGSPACARDGTGGEDCACCCKDRRTLLLLGKDDPGSVLERRKQDSPLCVAGSSNN